MINQVDGSPSNPYLFISCSDDETVKIWGVKDKIKIEYMGENDGMQQSYKKIDVKNEGISQKPPAPTLLSAGGN